MFSQFRRFASFSCRLVMESEGRYKALLKNIGRDLVVIYPIKSSGVRSFYNSIFHPEVIITYNFNIEEKKLSSGREVEVGSINLNTWEYGCLARRKLIPYEYLSDRTRKVISGLKITVYFGEFQVYDEGIENVEISEIDQPVYEDNSPERFM